MRHLRTLADLAGDELVELVELALHLKEERRRGGDGPQLPGRVLGMLFEKPSLRTRVSFEAGFAHLGGATVFLSGPEVGLGQRETVADFARVVSTYVDLLAVRVFDHAHVDELARHASCPVINALSDAAHPCQALADLCTMQEQFGRTDGLKVAFVGDGNNVARSLAWATAAAGSRFVLAAPPGHGFPADFRAALPEEELVAETTDPREAARDADVVYADVWASMGQEDQREQRLRVFADYQIDGPLLALAKTDARFMHCLPAHRGEEVTAEVIDGPASVVVDQAENRMHAQKALMLMLLDAVPAAVG